MEAQFVTDVLDMSFGCAHCDGEAIGDLGVGHPFRDKLCDLTFRGG